MNTNIQQTVPCSWSGFCMKVRHSRQHNLRLPALGNICIITRSIFEMQTLRWLHRMDNIKTFSLWNQNNLRVTLSPTRSTMHGRQNTYFNSINVATLNCTKWQIGRRNWRFTAKHIEKQNLQDELWPINPCLKIKYKHKTDKEKLMQRLNCSHE